MSSKKIQDLPLKTPIDAMKIPTGGFGDYAVTLKTIIDHFIEKYNLVQEDQISELERNVKLELDKKVNKNNVYTKDEIDGLISLFNGELSEEIVKNLVLLENLDSELQGKANSSDVYLKTETYSQQEINVELESKIESVNGKTGKEISLTRDDVGVPTDTEIKSFEKEDRFVITESGRTQRELNNILEGQAQETKDYVDSAVFKAGNGIKNFATELLLKAYTPTENDPLFAFAFDTAHSFEWVNNSWVDLGSSQLEKAEKFTTDEIVKLRKTVDNDFLPKYSSSSDELLLAITDDVGNLTWLQVDKQTGLPTQAVIDVLQEINHLSIENEITTLNGEKIAVAIKDKNGNLTALTVRESDGMFVDDVVVDIGERLGVMSDSAEFKTYDTPININILRSISAGITRHIEKTPLPETPYNFTDSLGQNARIYLPANYSDNTPIPLVMIFDGVGGSSTPTVRDTYLTLLQQGVALCKSQGHGNSYGNSACMQSYLEVFQKACEIAPIGAVILVGNSMGGISAQNALLTGTIPNVSGLYLTDPTYDLRQRYDNGRKTEITSAYEIAEDGSDYAEKTKGYDPALRHWSQYRGLPIHIRASSLDTSVPLSEHSEKLREYLSLHNDVTLSDTGTAGHNTTDRFDADDLFSFIKKCTKI